MGERRGRGAASWRRSRGVASQQVSGGIAWQWHYAEAERTVRSTKEPNGRC